MSHKGVLLHVISNSCFPSRVKYLVNHAGQNSGRIEEAVSFYLL